MKIIKFCPGNKEKNSIFFHRALWQDPDKEVMNRKNGPEREAKYVKSGKYETAYPYH